MGEWVSVLVIRNRHRNRDRNRNRVSTRIAHHEVTKDTKDTKDLFFIDPQSSINYQLILNLEPSNR